MVYYNLDDYNNIIFSGYDYVLPENIVNIIKKLTTELGIIETTNVSVEKKKSFENDRNINSVDSTNYNSKRNKMGENVYNYINDVKWEKLPTYRPTKIEKKEGIEKTIDDIRTCLNKISNKNYDSQRDLILKYITELNNVVNTTTIDEEEQLEIKTQDENIELCKVANAIFDIASNNKFYSEIYASLYKELLDRFEIFDKIISKYLDQYLDSIKQIKYVDSNEDYNKYCENNKLNDKRKAMTAFIINLMKKQIIEKEKVLEIILLLQNLVFEYIDVDNKTNEVDEITENIFIFSTMSATEFMNVPEWNNIKSNIVKCSQYKAKEHKSISSRAIFKYMDILDFFKKNNTPFHN
jgi:hypothetical protein